MTGQTKAAQRNGDVFKVGDVVEFEMVQRRRRGTIIEDRGPLGTDGRHIYRLSVPIDADNTFEFELSADYLKLVRRAS
jgi:hypothetical protein